MVPASTVRAPRSLTTDSPAEDPVTLRRTLLTIMAIVATLVAWATPVLAQDVDVIRGRVTGSDSAIVAGARVTVTSVSGNVRRVTQTDRNGRFTMTFPGGDGDY